MLNLLEEFPPEFPDITDGLALPVELNVTVAISEKTTSTLPLGRLVVN